MNNKNVVMTDNFQRIQGAILKAQNKNYTIYKGVNTIGRNKTAIINLKNLNVSQNHAIIIVLDDTQHFISDLNSSNGTYLCNTKLLPFKLYELPNDVEVKFGDLNTSYLKTSNMDSTIHLETENIDATQNMTQNFYAATTQLMINDSLNNTRPNSTSIRFSTDSENIHEAATQVINYPPAVIDEFKKTVQNSNGSVDRDMDIHEAPTQLVTYEQEYDTTTSNIHVQADCSENNENTDQQEKHIQKNDIQPGILKNYENEDQQEKDIQQPSCSKNNENNDDQEKGVHELQTYKVSNLSQESDKSKLDRKADESSTQIDNEVCKLDESSQSTNKCLSDVDTNESFIQIQKSSNMSTVIEETVIEETVMEDSHIENCMNDSNDSVDFLAIQTPLESESLWKEATPSNDKHSTYSDSQDIGIPRKRPSRKLSSSEDLSLHQNDNITCNSDSETDIEEESNIQNKKSILKPQKQFIDSDSDTEFQDNMPQQSKPLNRITHSDSETDIEDKNSQDNKITESQDVIKPKILSKKVSALDSDSETDIEDNNEKESETTRDGNNTTGDTFNDTDYIPATQDAFAHTFMYKDSKVSNVNNSNSENVSSEESFKLGLTELMVESMENKVDDLNEEDKIHNYNKNNAEEKADTTENKSIDFGEDKNEVQNESLPTQKISSSVDENSKEGEDTQKSNTNLENCNSKDTLNDVISSVPAQIIKENQENEPASTISKTADVDGDTEELYMLATQKINFEDQPIKQVKKVSTDSDSDTDIEDNNEDPKISSKELDVDKETDDFYMMPTQKINEKDDHVFKTPQKKFNFRKKGVRLEESLSNIFSNNEEDLYSVPTQKLYEDSSEDIYLQALEKVKDNQTTDVHLQKTQDLNPKRSSNYESNTEEDFYLAPTQKINKNLEDRNTISQNNVKSNQPLLKSNTLDEHKDEEDIYLAPTQLINTNLEEKSTMSQNNVKSHQSLLNETKDEDLYMAPTQQIENENKILPIPQKVHSKSVPDNTIKNTDENHYIAATKLTTNLVPEQTNISTQGLEAYLQETEDLALTEQLNSNKKNSRISSPITKATIENKLPAVNDVDLQKPEDLEEPTNEAQQDTCMVANQPIHQYVASEENNGKHIQNITNINSGTKRHIELEPTTPKSKRMKKTIDDDAETLSQIDAFVKQPFTPTNRIKKPAVFSYPSPHKKITEELDDSPETLSQIERFIKEPVENILKPKIKSLPKKPTITNVPSKNIANKEETDVQSETLSQIEAFIKTPLNVTNKNKPSIAEKTEETSDDFQAPEQNLRAKKTKPHVSEEDCEFVNKTELRTNSINISHSDQEATKIDVEKSFALLEAKSTKTRKSQRITNAAEIKVSVCKNRRSMATSVMPESSDDVFQSKPATRKTRKKSVSNNNNLETVPDSESKVTVRSKRKLEPVKVKEIESELSESEKPNKILRTYSRKSKQIKKIDTDTDVPIPTTSKTRASRVYTSEKKSDPANINEKIETKVIKQKEETKNNIQFSTPSTSKIRTHSKDSSDGFDESNNNSNKSILSTPSRRGKRNTQNTTLLSSAEKSKRKQKPKIVFTMLESPLLESLIRQLGGSVVDSVDSSTVLITEHVKRSQKLLTAIGQGKPICSPQWIHASKKANEFLDPWDYILLDKEAESKWDFSLKESLNRANKEKLLENYSFQLMVNNAADVLKGAIEACGGKCVPRHPAKNTDGFFVVIASPENRSKYLKIKKQHPQVTVVEPEAIFDGVLRQDLRLGRHLLT